jgi:hypothetical protein
VILTDHLLDGDLAAILGAIHRFKPNVIVAPAPSPASSDQA